MALKSKNVLIGFFILYPLIFILSKPTDFINSEILILSKFLIAPLGPKSHAFTTDPMVGSKDPFVFS